MDQGWARKEKAEEAEVHCCLNHLSILGVLLEQVWQGGLGPTQLQCLESLGGWGCLNDPKGELQLARELILG